MAKAKKTSSNLKCSVKFTNTAESPIAINFEPTGMAFVMEPNASWEIIFDLMDDFQPTIVEDETTFVTFSDTYPASIYFHGPDGPEQIM